MRVMGKGRKERIVPLTATAIEAMQRYFARRKTPGAAGSGQHDFVGDDIRRAAAKNLADGDNAAFRRIERPANDALQRLDQRGGDENGVDAEMRKGGMRADALDG